MTKRNTGAAQAAAPAPKKRPSGKPGRHAHPMRRFHAPQAALDLIDQAIEHNAQRKRGNGGYSGFSDWARHHLVLAAADELGIDPLDALTTLKS